MKNRQKEVRGIRRISHFFLSDYDAVLPSEANKCQKNKNEIEKHSPSANDVSTKEVSKRRSTSDFFTIFNKLIDRSDVPHRNVIQDANSFREEDQEVKKQSGSNLTLHDFLTDTDDDIHPDNELTIEPNGLAIGRKKTILFVDAEESLLRLGKEILGNSDYRVLTATDTQIAIELYTDESNQIDIVILDLFLPGIGGRRCLEELIRIDSKVKIVVNSAVSDSRVVKQIIENGAKAYIAKPYHFGQMLKVIRSVLATD